MMTVTARPDKLPRRVFDACRRMAPVHCPWRFPAHPVPSRLMAEIRIGLIGGSGLGGAMRAEADPPRGRGHDAPTPLGDPPGALFPTDRQGPPRFLLPPPPPRPPPHPPPAPPP